MAEKAEDAGVTGAMKLSGGGATVAVCGATPPTATVAGVKLKPEPEPG